MSEGAQAPVYCRHEEAVAYIASTTDPRLKSFLSFGLTAVLMRRRMGGAMPASTFDLRFFLEALRSMFEDETYIRLILEGRQEEMRWWDDDATPP